MDCIVYGVIKSRINAQNHIIREMQMKTMMRYYLIPHTSIIFLLFIKMKSESESQSYQTVCDPMGYTAHGILQARILEWVAFLFSRGSSQPRDQTQVSRIAGEFFTC